MSARVFDATRCLLGEGALWHPEREQLFWCDILSNRVLSRVAGEFHEWSFERPVSCLGWVDRDRLIVATDADLTLLDLETNERERVVDLEADNPETRGNDGRADPQGGFWVSTMGIDKAVGAGALYRYYRGELRRLRAGMSAPNTICFTPDHRHAYFSDTPTQMVMRWRLGTDGWPEGEPDLWLDLRGTDLNPDGGICDADGNVWNAQFGAGRIACYGPDGNFRHAVEIPASQTTCPAFGGSDLSTLFVTSAAAGLSEVDLARVQGHGRTFSHETGARGRAEHRVVL